MSRLWLCLALAVLWRLAAAENAKIPDPLALFSKAGNSWPALPCRMFAGVSPAKSDGKFIYTPSGSDLVVWNDVSCSSSAATAELRVTRTFQEEIDAIAFLPPKTIVIASKRSWTGLNYARLRFYNAGDLGHSTAPMFMRRFDGHITSLLVLGYDLLFAATFTKAGENFIHCLSDVLTERKKPSQKLKTQYPVRKILAFQNFVLGASLWQLMMWRRETMFGQKLLPIQWEVPSRSNTTRSMAIEDMCLLQPHHLAVAANPVNGFGGGAVLYVFDLKKASGFAELELVATLRQETVLKSLAGISALGLAVGTVNRSVNLYRISDLLGAQQPYKRLTVVKSFPTKLGFVHDAYLAVGTAENQVETFGWKRLLRGKSKGQASMIIPIESRVVEFLELPGQGLAVAGLQHVHFFSASAIQFTSARKGASFSSLSSCMETAGVGGRILGFQPLSEHRVIVALPDSNLVLCKLELPNVYRYSGSFQLPDQSYTQFMPLSFPSLEIPQANLLAVGGFGHNLVLYNLSDAKTVRDTNYTAHLRTTLMVQALASHGTTLMVGTQNRVYVWTTQDFRHWTRVDRILHAGNCWDLAYLGNDLWAAASEMEVVTLYHFDGALKALKTLGVKGPAYAMSPLSGALLVVTEFTLHLFEAEALDPALRVNFSAAELPVNGVNSPPPANSISIVGDAILVGLELYRPRNPDAECAQGTYSPPGAFECRSCPDGWTSFGAAGSCSYPNSDTLFFMMKLLLLALLVFVWMVPQLLRRLMKMSNVAVFAEPPDAKSASAAVPYALVLAFPVYASLAPGPFLALAPLASSLLAAWPAKPSTARAGLICLAASSFLCSVSPALWCQVCGVLRFANVTIAGCNAYFTLQIRRWLNNSFVNTQDGIRANTAGVRVIIMLSATLYFSSGCLVVLNLSQHHGHEVWTPLGLAEPSDTFLPTYLLAGATALSMVALGFAANACMEAEELHQPSLWARDEKVPPAKLPRSCRVPWLLRLSSWCKSWRFRHFLFLASALYDSYTFYRGLQNSKKALSSQMYDFAAILFFAMFTASINAMALLLDHFRMHLPELGDRNFRLSSLCKCILLFLKLRVLKVPLLVSAHMDSTWLTEYSGYIREKGERIPIWMCSDPLSCPFRCRQDLEGNCTYTSQPVYLGCFCQYSTAGIPVVSDRLMVFGNCLISACIIALLTNSRMRTRGLFRFPDLSLFALGCVTFLPTAFIAINTVYLSVPQLARMHLDSWRDFLVLTVPALVFVVMANEMARRIETAWKLRSLGHEERVKLRCSDGQWQVVDGAPHLLGARVEALDGEGRSLLGASSAVTVQGPAVLFFKNPQRYGSLWVSSGFRALTPLAHLSTLLAILQVWQRLFQGVIFIDVLILLVLSGASGVLNFTLMDEEVVSLIRRPSSRFSTAQILFDDAKGHDSRTGSSCLVELQPA